MSKLSVKVKKISYVETHPNADLLDLIHVDGYICVTQKNKYAIEDLVAYIPEQSVVPISLLEEMGLKDKLGGGSKNRVKAIRLRGILSQGLIYPAKPNWTEGQDVSEELGITKWEPTVPASFSGKLINVGQHNTVSYDIENIKAYPNILNDNEEVIFTEKIHGTFCQFVSIENNVYPGSKGLGARGLCLDTEEESNKLNNVYVKAYHSLDIKQKVLNIRNYINKNIKQTKEKEPIMVCGEVFGQGVQDLGYGYNSTDNIGFRVFDVYVGYRGQGFFLNHGDLDLLCKECNLERVPVLYKGPFSFVKVHEHTSGFESVSGKSKNIREGIVVRPITERTDKEIGRVQLKSVSENYLLRKNGTEFN